MKLLEEYLPPEVQAGLPSALLERRPDLREAEQALRAANARVGVATADFFPDFTLTGLLGRVSIELSDFTDGDANLWSVGGNLSGPLFTWGRLTGQLEQAEAAAVEARLRYQQTALTALREVSDALITRETLEGERVQRTEEVNALIEAVQVANERYLQGKSSYYEVLEAQQQLFPAENALARTQLDQYVVIVQLYRALGGGWKLSDFEVIPLHPPAAPPP